MDTWLKLSLIAAALFCVVIITDLVVRHIRFKRAIGLRDSYRCRHPAVAAQWDEVTSGYDPRTFVDPDDPMFDQADEPLPPAMLAPPNIGGEGHPPYEGPNYTAPEDIAQEMKHLGHYDAVVGQTPWSERYEGDTEDEDNGAR